MKEKMSLTEIFKEVFLDDDKLSFDDFSLIQDCKDSLIGTLFALITITKHNVPIDKETRHAIMEVMQTNDTLFDFLSEIASEIVEEFE